MASRLDASLMHIEATPDRLRIRSHWEERMLFRVLTEREWRDGLSVEWTPVLPNYTWSSPPVSGRVIVQTKPMLQMDDPTDGVWLFVEPNSVSHVQAATRRRKAAQPRADVRERELVTA